MRPFLLLCMTFFSMSSTAAQENWEGYRTVEESSLSGTLRSFAENSVFQMISVGSVNVRDDAFEILSTDSQPQTSDRYSLDSNYRSLQIETCRRQNLKKCPVTHNVRTGTLFFNNGKYTTCRHLFHNWLVRASQENRRSIETLTPPMILRKATRIGTSAQVVYNSAYDPLFQMHFLQAHSAINTLYYSSSYNSDERVLFKLFDIVQMTLSGSTVGVDAQLSEITNVTQELQRASDVFIVGYPSRTQVFNGRGDAPGDVLVVSHGLMDRTYDATHPNYLPHSFMSTAYNSGGISGGPVLSSDGLILGLHCTRDANIDPIRHDLVKSIAYPFNMDFLSQIWEDKGYPVSN